MLLEYVAVGVDESASVEALLDGIFPGRLPRISVGWLVDYTVSPCGTEVRQENSPTGAKHLVID